MVRHGETISSLERIRAGVPQGSVLGPTLFLLFTSDLPTPHGVVIGTLADDTAVLSTAYRPQLASSKLQLCLNDLSKWLTKWRIKVNESK